MQWSRHGETVCAVSSSPDGKFFASAGPKNIKVWDAEKKECLMTRRGHMAVAFSPYHDLLAFWSDANTVVLLQRGSWTQLAVCNGHNKPISAVAFSRSGHLASASDDGTIRIWDSKGNDVASLKANRDKYVVRSLAFSPTASGHLASVVEDGIIQIWDTKSWKLLRLLPNHGTSHAALAFSPDGKVLASASIDGSISIWGTELWKCLVQFQPHGGDVTTLAFSPDGKALASASIDNSIKIWGTESWECLATDLCVSGAGSVEALTFLDDQTVVAGTFRGSVALWPYLS